MLQKAKVNTLNKIIHTEREKERDQMLHAVKQQKQTHRVALGVLQCLPIMELVSFSILYQLADNFIRCEIAYRSNILKTRDGSQNSLTIRMSYNLFTQSNQTYWHKDSYFQWHKSSVKYLMTTVKLIRAYLEANINFRCKTWQKHAMLVTELKIKENQRNLCRKKSVCVCVTFLMCIKYKKLLCYCQETTQSPP